MLQSIRDRAQSGFIIAAIALFAIIFILWDIHGYLDLNNTRESKIVATVAGQSLSQSEFDKAYQRLYQQTQQHFGTESVSHEKMASQLKQQIVEQWVSTQLLAQAALQENYRVSQASIDTILLTIPAFQSAGRFSSTRFYNALNAMGYTAPSFLADLKKAFLINQVQQGLVQSAFVLPGEIKKSVALTQQKRDFAYLIIPSSRFLSNKLPVSDSQILAYYQKNKYDFMQPEVISIDYIKLSLANQKNDKVFAEVRDKLANLAYTHPDSLVLIAKTLGLSIQSTSLFSRTGGEYTLTKDPKVLAAAFSQDVLQGNNSPILDLNANTAIVLRVKQHKAATIQPLSVVREKIIAILRKQIAAEKTQAWGENMLNELKKTGVFTESANHKHLSWRVVKQVDRYDDHVPSPLLRAAFQLPPSSTAKTSVVGLRLANGDYALVKLMAIQEGDSSLAPQKQMFYRSALAKNFGQSDYELYTQGLMEKAKRVIYHYPAYE